jgi:hypothetical protein
MRLPKGAVITVHDVEELRRFGQWLGVETARKTGADAEVCNMLERAIYPDGISRDEAVPKVDS